MADEFIPDAPATFIPDPPATNPAGGSVYVAPAAPAFVADAPHFVPDAPAFIPDLPKAVPTALGASQGHSPPLGAPEALPTPLEAPDVPSGGGLSPEYAVSPDLAPGVSGQTLASAAELPLGPGPQPSLLASLGRDVIQPAVGALQGLPQAGAQIEQGVASLAAQQTATEQRMGYIPADGSPEIGGPVMTPGRFIPKVPEAQIQNQQRMELGQNPADARLPGAIPTPKSITDKLPEAATGVGRTLNQAGQLASLAATGAAAPAVVAGQMFGQQTKQLQDQGVPLERANAAAAAGAALKTALFELGPLGQFMRNQGVKDAAARGLDAAGKYLAKQFGIGAASEAVDAATSSAARGQGPVEPFEHPETYGQMAQAGAGQAAAAGILHAAYHAYRKAVIPGERYAAAEQAFKAAGGDTGGMGEDEARQVLGLDPREVLTPASVKRAWAQKIQDVHPDARGTPEQFARVQAARAALDPEMSRRRRANQQRQETQQPPPPPPPGGQEQSVAAAPPPTEQTTGEADAVQEQAPEGQLQRQPPEDAGPGRERAGGGEEETRPAAAARDDAVGEEEVAPPPAFIPDEPPATDTQVSAAPTPPAQPAIAPTIAPGAGQPVQSTQAGPRVSSRQPLPLPPLHEDIDPGQVKHAWDVMSQRFPQIAALVQRIGPLDIYKRPQALARFKTADGTLEVHPDKILTPSVLVHELVHAVQGDRGLVAKLQQTGIDLHDRNSPIEAPAYKAGERFNKPILPSPPQRVPQRYDPNDLLHALPRTDVAPPPAAPNPPNPPKKPSPGASDEFDRNAGPFTVEWGTRSNGRESEEFDDYREAVKHAKRKGQRSDFVTIYDANQNEQTDFDEPPTPPSPPEADVPTYKGVPIDKPAKDLTDEDLDKITAPSPEPIDRRNRELGQYNDDPRFDVRLKPGEIGYQPNWPPERQPTRSDFRLVRDYLRDGTLSPWGQRIQTAADRLTALSGGKLAGKPALKSARAVIHAIDTGRFNDILHPGNKNSRQLYNELTGRKLPSGLAATKKAVELWASTEKPAEPPAAENPPNPPNVSQPPAPEGGTLPADGDRGHDPSLPVRRPQTDTGGDLLDGPGVPESPEPVRAGTGTSGEPGQRAGERAGDEGRDDAATGGQDVPQPDGGRAGAAAPEGGRGGSVAGRPARDVEPLKPEERNHVITPGTQLAPTGNAAKFHANLDAIDLLKQLQAQDRNATPEEKKVLAAYTGWGWAGEYFNPDKYPRQNAEIRKRLTDVEYAAARKSTLNAHYTAPEVIVAMWKAMRRLGMQPGSRVLEPSAGVGHFFGLMPQDLAEGARLVGVELDNVSAGILAKLYPQADIRNEGFEQTRVANNSLDVAISNVPFGKFTLAAKDYPALTIHNYFFARALDKVRPGGVVAFITSHFTMDAGSRKVRQLLSEKADLIGAIRLPGDAFKANAGTAVVTDVIFLRKKDLSGFKGEPWTEVTKVGEGTYRDEDGNTVTGPININEYFEQHPAMALGKHALSGTMRSKGGYDLQSDGNLPAQLDAAVDALPQNVLGERPAELEQQEQKVAAAADKELSTVDRDGKLWQVRDGNLVPPDWLTQKTMGKDPEAGIGPSVAAKRVKVARQWVGLRDAIKELFNAENRPDADAGELAKLRAKLNRVYDAYVSENGTATRRFTHLEAAAFLQDDPEYPLVQSVETPDHTVDAKTGKEVFRWVKGDIFRRRIREPRKLPETAKDANEAITISLGWRNAIDLDLIGKLLGKGADEVKRDVLRTERAFENPESGLIEPREHYLSGNVRKKLDVAERAAKENPDYAMNVAALKAVQPERVPLGEIFLNLSSRWIPDEVLTAFANDVLDAPGTIKKVDLANSYVIDLEGSAKFDTFATARVRAGQILRHALHGTQPTVKEWVGAGRERREVVDTVATKAAEQAVAKLRRTFVDWAKTAETGINGVPAHRVLEDAYNLSNNSVVPPTYDGSHLVLPGLNAAIVPRNHQRAIVARVLQEGGAVMAHGVGSGKTYSQIITAMELRRLGLAKKPMIVVQKSTVGQFAASFRTAYPDAKVIVANEKTFAKRNRHRLMARIAMGDHDAVIVTQPQFDKLALSPVAVRRYFDQQFDELDEAIRAAAAANGKKDPSVKDLEAAKSQLQARMTKMLASAEKSGDKVLTFDQLGVDHLLIDEAHAYKKLPIVTKMRRVKGIPSDPSVRAMTLAIKAMHVQEKQKGRGVVLATGTPITNTMAEAYVMIKLAMPQALEEYNITTFDSFAHTFGEPQTKVEFTWSGDWKMQTRFNRFVNGPELIRLIRSVFDVKMGNKELGLKVPEIKGGKPEVVVVQQSPSMQKVNDFLLDVADAFDDTSDKRDVSWVPILTMQAGMAAALDPRLVDPSLPDEPDSKLNQAVKRVVEIYHQSTAGRGTQLVFADRFRPMSTTLLRQFLGDGHDGPLIIIHDEEDGQTDLTKGSEDEEESDVDGDEQARLKQEDADYKAAGLNLYKELKAKLVKAGIPEAEVGIIHEFNTDRRREQLFESMNAGKIRVLIGSTEKMGVGVNVQKRLVAEHQLDPPRMMTPAMDEQRRGRIIRQGNDNDEVQLIQYGTARSMDIGIYQMLEDKQRMLTQALSGKAQGRAFVDPGDEIAMQMAAIKASLTGDDTAIRFAEVSQKLRNLQDERYAFQQEKSNKLSKLYSAEQRIKNIRDVWEPDYRRVSAALATAFDGEWRMNSPFTGEASGREAVAKLLSETFEELEKQYGGDAGKDARMSSTALVMPVTINGWRVMLGVRKSPGGMLRDYKISDDPKNAPGSHMIANPDVKGGDGMLRSLGSQAERMTREADSYLKEADQIDGSLATLRRDAAVDWTQQGELDKLEAEFAALEARLLASGGTGRARRRRKNQQQTTELLPGKDNLPFRTPHRGERGSFYLRNGADLVKNDEDGGLAGGVNVPGLGAHEQATDEAQDEGINDLGAKITPPTSPRIPVAPLPGGTGKSLTNIILDLTRQLGHKVRVANPGRQFGGMYYPGSTRTVIRFAGDMDTTAHEVAHLLDDKFGLVSAWAKPRKRSPFDKELIPNFSGYGTVASGKRSKLAYQRAEGVAEWLRALVMNPDAARAAAPTFAAHYDATVPAPVRAAVDRFSEQVRKWAGLPKHEQALTNIEWTPEHQGVTRKLREALAGEPWSFQTTWLDKLNAAALDSLAPVMKGIDAAKGLRPDLGSLLPEQDPETLIRLMPGFNDKYEQQLDTGLVDLKGQKVTPGGVKWLLEPLDQSSAKSLERDMRLATALMVSQRTIEKAQQVQARVQARIDALLAQAGLPPGTTVPTGDPKLDAKIQRLQRAADDRMARMSGIGGGIYHDVAQAAAAISELRADPARYAKLQEAAKRLRTWHDELLKVYVQSGRLSKEAYDRIRAANEYYVSFQRLMDEVMPAPRRGGKALASADEPVKRLKGSTRRIENPYVSLLEQTYRILREADRNNALRSFRDLLTVNRSMYDGDPRDLDAIGSRDPHGPHRDGVRIWVNGKPEYWQFEPGVHQALKNWGQVVSGNVLESIAKAIPRAARFFITHSPAFAVRNIIRDSSDRFLVSGHGSKPWDSAGRFTQAEREGFKLGGGGQFGNYMADRVAYHKELRRRMDQLRQDKSAVLMLPGRLSRAWGHVVHESELRGRLAEYRRAFHHAKAKLGYDDHNATLYAAKAARDILDFAVAGTFVKKLNEYVPFTNARVQGAKIQAERLARNPAVTAARWALGILLPTLAVYALAALRGKDSLDEYRQLPTWRRDLFWNVKVGPLWLSIPKPYEAGALATTVERLIDRAAGNKNAFEGHALNLVETIAPVDKTALGGPFQGIVEGIANKDFFLDRSIVPPYEEGKDLSLRDTSRASRIGQALQSVTQMLGLDVDARKIDHFLRNTGGGSYALPADVADVGRDDRQPERFLQSGLGVFTSPPAYTSKDVQWVLDAAHRLGIEQRRDIKGLQNLLHEQARAKTMADRDAQAAVVRKAAAEIRADLEKSAPEILEAQQGKAGVRHERRNAG